MKEIKLKKIVLSNWKKQNKEVEFFNKTLIEGRNGSGKTSIANAWYWLLTTYTDAYSNPNNELFDNTKEINKDTPKAIVTAHISIDNIDYVISKSAEAKFVRERGSDEYVKAKSDVYTYSIDNIEISANDFKQWIKDNICDYDLIKYCLNGQFFTNLCEDDKFKSRKILESIVSREGEILIDDVQNKYPNIYDKIFVFKIEDIIEQNKKEIKPIEDRINIIPQLIKQKEDLINSLEVCDRKVVQDRIDEIKKLLLDVDSNIKVSDNKITEINSNIKAYYKEIADIVNKIAKAESEYTISLKSEISNTQKNLYELNLEKTNIENTINKLNNDLNSAKHRLKVEEGNKSNIYESLVSLREKRDSLKESVFEKSGVCPTCGQAYPQEYLDKEEERFNIDKANKLKNIIEHGKYTKLSYDATCKMIEDIKKEISNIEDNINSMPIKLKEVCDKIESENTKIASIKEHQVKWEDTDIYKQLNEEYNIKKKNTPILSDDIVKNNEQLKGHKTELIDEMNMLSKKLGIIEQINSINSQIVDLKEERQNLGIKIAKLEGIINECKRYIEEKASIIEKKINEYLNDCKIQMWNVQKDGNIVPDCIIKNNKGVKYSTMNNSDRIKTNISIQIMFCNKFGINLPIFIDEYSIFDSYNAPKIEGNIIALRASDDTILKITELK